MICSVGLIKININIQLKRGNKTTENNQATYDMLM